MHHRLHALALAAALLAAGSAHAQSTGSGANVSTQASASGSLTQTSDRADGTARQSLLVAATEADTNLGSSTLTLKGSVAADQVQNRSGAGNGSLGLQRISVGGASGFLQLRAGSTDGQLLAPVVQNQSSNGVQHVGVATLNNAEGSVQATATVSGLGIRQELSAGTLA